MYDNLSNKELNLSNLAIDIALQSNQHYKLGCIIIKNGKIVCKHFNDKRSRINGKNFVCIHAEINCIHNLLKYEKNNRKLKNYSMLVIRIGKDDDGNIVFRNAKPCKYCTESIKKIGLKKIIYSNDDGDLEKIKINELESEYISKGYDRMNHIILKSY
tara:strand:- start:694 stop:1167 length:474 start_codon:yes stop_codon:yes gene_type:complete